MRDDSLENQQAPNLYDDDGLLDKVRVQLKDILDIFGSKKPEASNKQFKSLLMKYVLEQDSPANAEELITDEVISSYRGLLIRYRSGESRDIGWLASIESALLDKHLNPRLAFLLACFTDKKDLVEVA